MSKKKKKTPFADFVKEIFTIAGGLAGSIMAIYGVVKTFRDDVEGFSWLILLGIIILISLIKQLFQMDNRIAYILLILSVLGGAIGWVGWQSHTKMIKEKVIVLVAQFDGPEETYGLHNQIMEDLRQATKGYDDTVIIVDGKDIVTAGQGSEYARELGQKEKADIVIWAWYRPTENPNITVHIENLSPTEVPIIQESTSYQPEATIRELESFYIQKEIGSNTSSLISVITGYIRYRAGDYRVALERFNYALEENNKSFFISEYDLLLFIGLSYENLGECNNAVTIYGQAVELEPEMDFAYNNRGFCLLELQQNDEAINDFTRAIQVSSHIGSAYNNRGLSYHFSGQYENAISDYTQAIQAAPENAANYYSNRGLVYMDMGQAQSAISDYTQAIEIDHNWGAAYGNRGYVYQELGRYEESIIDYSEAIRIRPDFAFLYAGRGIAYGSLGQYEKAIKDISRAIKLEPNNPTWYNDRGTGYNYWGQYENAISDYSRAIQLDPDYADAYRNRGVAYKAIDEISKSEADFSKYEELTGQKP